MSLPDTEIEEELIDSSTLEKIDESWPHHISGSPPVATNSPPQMANTSRMIGETLQDMAMGRSDNRYPAVDKIVNQDPDRYAETVCTPDCPHRSRQERQINRHLIADVRPPLKERMAVIEHEIDDINQIIGSHQEMILLAATRDALKDAEHESEKRVENVHLRIDRDVFPRIEKMETKRLVRDWGLTISLTVSLIYSVILTYKTFIEG